MADAAKVYGQLKDCISSITKIPRPSITLNDTLASYGYRDEGSRTALAVSLERCFRNNEMPIPKTLDRDRMRAATTLKKVRDVVYDAFGV
jgi:hypothetical protein